MELHDIDSWRLRHARHPIARCSVCNNWCCNAGRRRTARGSLSRVKSQTRLANFALMTVMMNLGLINDMLMSVVLM